MDTEIGLEKTLQFKRIDVTSVGLPMSDQLLLRALLQLIAPIGGHDFALSDDNDAPIVVFNPADSQAETLMRNPQHGVAYIQYGTPEIIHRQVWRLAKPVRLPAMREILTGIVEQRREWKFSGALAPKAEVSQSLPSTPVPAHRRLEDVLKVLENVVQSRIPHSLSGISGVEALVLPLNNAVYIQCDPSAGVWHKALVETQRPIAAFSHIGARPMSETKPISIAHFRWELARHLSAGMLLPGIACRQEFALTRWPDFGTMTPGSAFDLRIVALITARPTSIANMLKTVPYTREGIIALLNCCAVVGCLSDAPADLLHSVEAQTLKPEQLREPSVAAPNRAAATLTNQAMPSPQVKRGFAGVLSKLRAALTYSPWSKA